MWASVDTCEGRINQTGNEAWNNGEWSLTLQDDGGLQRNYKAEQQTPLYKDIGSN
jgi:hypothetical protein